MNSMYNLKHVRAIEYYPDTGINILLYLITLPVQIFWQVCLDEQA